MNRKKMAIMLGGVLMAAIGLVSWLILKPVVRHFQRLTFAVVAGESLQYNLQEYCWQHGEERIAVGRAISAGRGVTFRQRAELRLCPEWKGKAVVFFSYSVKSFLPEGIQVTVVQQNRSQERIVQLFEVAAKKDGYFSSLLFFERDDAILVRAEGGGVLILGDAVIADITTPERRRYVFVVAPDTFRGDRLCKWRGNVLLTPNLEAFRRDAVVFENAIAPSSWTLPSFASFFSGLYEYRHQVTRSSFLTPDQPHLLANLAPDYVTVQFNDDVWLSPKVGFARNSDCFLTSSQPSDIYADRCLFDNARSFLQANPLPALFMFLHTYKLHTPYEPGEEFLAAVNSNPRYRRMGGFVNKSQFKARVPEVERQAMEELYDAEVLQFDHFFGAFIQYLKLAGIYDQSMILLISDHGDEFGEHGGWFHGHSLYREVSQVPFLIKFPEGLHAGRHCREFVSICDALPTVLDYLKKKVPPGIDGISLLPLLQGARAKRRPIFSSAAVSLFNDYLPPRFAMFFDHYQLIFNFPSTAKARKYYEEFGQPPVRPSVELYDLQSDPMARSDISTRQKKLLDSLWPRMIPVLREIRRPLKKKFVTGALSEEELSVLRSLGYL
jgi:choline-sulfatase